MIVTRSSKYTEKVLNIILWYMPEPRYNNNYCNIGAKNAIVYIIIIIIINATDDSKMLHTIVLYPTKNALARQR